MKEFLKKGPEFIVRRFDLEGEGRIDERKVGMQLHHAQNKSVIAPHLPPAGTTTYGSEHSCALDHSDDSDWEEEEEDFVSGPDQIEAIKSKAFWMLASGTALVVLFSDPMVAVMTELGKRTGIPLFYL